MKIIHTNYYDLSFGETSIEITEKPLTRTVKTYRLLERVAVFILMPLILLGLVVFCVKPHSPAIIIAGIAFLSAAICLVLIDIKHEKIRNNKFKQIVNDKGITHIDYKKTFHLDWSDVKSFGIVNRVHLSNSFGILGLLRINRRYGSQTILYFSNESYNDKELLRRKLSPKIPANYYRSTPDMIVFEFQEDDIEQEVREKLYPYIHKYCDANKELSFIETAPWV